MIDNNDITNELNMITRQEIVERASDKAFSKLVMLDIELSRYKDDLLSGNYGGITRREVKLIIEGTKKEITTWNYIATLIEKDELTMPSLCRKKRQPPRPVRTADRSVSRGKPCTTDCLGSLHSCVWSLA